MQNYETVVMAAHLEREQRISKHLEEESIRRQLAEHPSQMATRGRHKPLAARKRIATGRRDWFRRAVALLRCHCKQRAATHRTVLEAPGER